MLASSLQGSQSGIEKAHASAAGLEGFIYDVQEPVQCPLDLVSSCSPNLLVKIEHCVLLSRSHSRPPRGLSPSARALESADESEVLYAVPLPHAVRRYGGQSTLGYTRKYTVHYYHVYYGVIDPCPLAPPGNRPLPGSKHHWQFSQPEADILSKVVPTFEQEHRPPCVAARCSQESPLDALNHLLFCTRLSPPFHPPRHPTRASPDSIHPNRQLISFDALRSSAPHGDFREHSDSLASANC